MIKFAVFVAVLDLAALYLIYIRLGENRARGLKAAGALFFLNFATVFLRYLYIYIPILILHIIFLLLGWAALFYFLINKTERIWPVFLPLVSIALFFAAGLAVWEFD